MKFLKIMTTSNKDKNKLLLTTIAAIVIGGMVAFGYQMYLHNSRVIEEFTSVDIPDDEEPSSQWMKYTGSETCPIFVEQRFDANKSHYICMSLR